MLLRLVLFVSHRSWHARLISKSNMQSCLEIIDLVKISHHFCRPWSLMWPPFSVLKLSNVISIPIEISNYYVVLVWMCNKYYNILYICILVNIESSIVWTYLIHIYIYIYFNVLTIVLCPMVISKILNELRLTDETYWI